MTRYVLPRLMQWLLVVFIGVTVAFIIPRFAPIDPVQTAMGRLSTYTLMNAEAAAKLEQTLKQLFGLEGSLWSQYVRFWKRLLSLDLGPSLSMFPTPVTEVLRTSLPWTVALMLTATTLAWLLGIVLGTISGWYRAARWARILDIVMMTLYPVPYYIVALALLLLLAYVFPLFPLMGGAGIGLGPALSWTFLSSAAKHGFLPALSLVLVATGWSYLGQKALVANLVSSDFVTYARIAGAPTRTILLQYLIRNSLLPQATDLALSLGSIFSGALVTEYVFAYPGLGYVLYTAILQGDYNLMMGIVVLSIAGIATAALAVDLIYPLLDPRVRYR